MIDIGRDNALLKSHEWRAQIGHHNVKITAEIDETPTLHFKRKVTPPLNQKKKKRNREFLKVYRAFRATILDDIAKIVGHEQFGNSTNFRAMEKWENGVVE